MASKKHTPAKGTVVQVEPYYPEFHELLLNELMNLQKQVRPRKPLQAASEQRHSPMPTKPATNIRPPLLPKPSSRGSGRHDLFRQVHSYKDQYASHETLETSENSFTIDERSYPSRDERGGRGYSRRRSRKTNYRGRARGFLPTNNKSGRWDHHNLEESNDKQTFHETHPQRGRWGKNYNHYSNDFVGDDSFLDQAQSSDQHYKQNRSDMFEKQYSKRQTRSHVSPKAHDSMSKPVITLDADCNYVPSERPAVSDWNVFKSFSQNDNFASDFSDSELYSSPTSRTDRSAEIQEILPEENSCTTSYKAEERNLSQQQAAHENLSRQKLAEEENERKEKVELERKNELEEENERLKRELEKFKSQKTETVDVPAYKLYLLSNFPQECKTCSVIFLPNDGKVKFTGSEDDCLAAKVDFLSRVQVSLLAA